MQQKDREYLKKAAEEILPPLVKHIGRIRKIANEEERKFHNAYGTKNEEKFDVSAGLLLQLAESLEDAGWQLEAISAFSETGAI